jgi:hypothetical protein
MGVSQQPVKAGSQACGVKPSLAAISDNGFSSVDHVDVLFLSLCFLILTEKGHNGYYGLPSRKDFYISPILSTEALIDRF